MNLKRNRMEGKAMPAWLVFLTGILVGAFSAFLYYLSLHEIGADAPDLVKKSIETINKLTEKVQSTNEQVVDSSKFNFDFYTILPDLEMIVQKSLSVSKSEVDKSPKTVEKNELKSAMELHQIDNYILQAGSFKNLKQASHLKDRLYELGIMTNIQKVTFKNHDTWYRVRVGPMQDHDAILKIQEILSKNNINSLLMKVTS